MRRRLSIRVTALVGALLLLSTATVAGYGLYRCRHMDQVRRDCCCPEEAKAAAPVDSISDERCCAFSEVAPERLPSRISPDDDVVDAGPPSVLPPAVLLPVPSLARAPSDAGASPSTGPPLHLLHLALLI